MTNATAEETFRDEKLERIKSVSEKIREVLETNSMALQPFLSFSEYGIVASVRLVETNKSENNDNGTDSEVSGGDQQEDGTTATQPA